MPARKNSAKRFCILNSAIAIIYIVIWIKIRTTLNLPDFATFFFGLAGLIVVMVILNGYEKENSLLARWI